MRVLILEDDLNDLLMATRIARRAGFEEIETLANLEQAIKVIEQGLRGERLLPEAVILDLNLGYDSGYEFLRHWRSIWKQVNIQIVVWSALGEWNQDLCAPFHVDAYVSKGEGEAALSRALQQLTWRA
jgi:DNA-binding response OmpR family regulator